MPPTTSLSVLMSEVLRQAGLRAPAPVDNAYTVHFDDAPSVHVLSIDDVEVDVISEAGHLAPARDAAMLLELLALNRLKRQMHPVTISVDRVSGAVLVWGRQQLAALDAAALRHLLQCVRQRSAAVQRLLERGAPVPRSSNAGKWARLLHLRR